MNRGKFNKTFELHNNQRIQLNFREREIQYTIIVSFEQILHNFR